MKNRGFGEWKEGGAFVTLWVVPVDWSPWAAETRWVEVGGTSNTVPWRLYASWREAEPPKRTTPGA